MSKFISIYFFLVLLSHNLFGQQKIWSLNDCINYAIENNISLMQSKLNIESATIVTHQAKLNYIPSVEFITGYQLSMGRSLDPTTYEFINNEFVNSANAGLNLGAIIWNGFKRINAIKKSSFDLNVSQYEFLTQKDNISLNVTSLYFNIILNKEIMRSIKAQLDISNANIEKMKRLVSEGAVADEQLQNLLMQRQSELYSLSESKGVLKKTIIDLCTLLNIDAYDQFEIDEYYHDDNITFSVAIEDIICSAMSLPQIEIINHSIYSAEYAKKIAKADLYPTLSLNSSYASSFSSARKQPILNELGVPIIENGSVLYTNYSFINQINDNRTGIVGFTLSVPILNSFNRKNNIKLSNINIKRLELELDNSKKVLSEEIRKIYIDVELLREKYSSSLKAINHGVKILSYSENKLNNGRSSITDYVVAKNNVLIYEIQASRVKYELLLKQKILRYYYTHTIN